MTSRAIQVRKGHFFGFEPIADRSWVARPPADTLDEHLAEQEWLVMDHEHGHPVDWPQAG